jgi:ribosomal protein S18 acetylase RimI-like enzyme
MSTMHIRRLLPADAGAFQTLRLAGLRQSPSAFGSSYEEERDTTLETIAGRLGERMLFGAFDGAVLAGIVAVGRESAAVGRESAVKLRHKAFIRAMVVADAWRGKGVGKLLLEHALDIAAAMEGVRQVTLDVTAGNVPAIRLYESVGFRIYGTEPCALFADGVYHDTVLMVRMVELAN